MGWFSGAGDSGMTELFGTSRRFQKDDLRLEALGTIDELNAAVGWCRALAPADAGELLKRVQETLFIIQAELAGAAKRLEKEKIESLEREITAIENSLPPVTSFVLPGGVELAARLECARTIARRAERRYAALGRTQKGKTSPVSLAYLNRLSSFLWALAREENHRAGFRESAPKY